MAGGGRPPLPVEARLPAPGRLDAPARHRPHPPAGAPAGWGGDRVRTSVPAEGVRVQEAGAHQRRWALPEVQHTCGHLDVSDMRGGLRVEPVALGLDQLQLRDRRGGRRLRAGGAALDDAGGDPLPGGRVRAASSHPASGASGWRSSARSSASPSASSPVRVRRARRASPPLSSASANCCRTFSTPSSKLFPYMLLCRMAIAGALETDSLASVLFSQYLSALGISAYARESRIAPLDEPPPARTTPEVPGPSRRRSRPGPS